MGHRTSTISDEAYGALSKLKRACIGRVNSPHKMNDFHSRSKGACQFNLGGGFRRGRGLFLKPNRYMKLRSKNYFLAGSIRFARSWVNPRDSWNLAISFIGREDGVFGVAE